MYGESGFRAAKLFKAFTIGHGRSLHRGARQDHRLGDSGQSEFGFQFGGHGCEGRNARRHIIGNLQLIEAAHLLGNCSVQGRIARMNPGHVLAFGISGLDLGDDLVEM